MVSPCQDASRAASAKEKTQGRSFAVGQSGLPGGGALRSRKLPNVYGVPSTGLILTYEGVKVRGGEAVAQQQPCKLPPDVRRKYRDRPRLGWDSAPEARDEGVAVRWRE